MVNGPQPWSGKAWRSEPAGQVSSTRMTGLGCKAGLPMRTRRRGDPAGKGQVHGPQDGPSPGSMPQGFGPRQGDGPGLPEGQRRRSTCNPGRARGKSRVSGTDSTAILCLELDSREGHLCSDLGGGWAGSIPAHISLLQGGEGAHRILQSPWVSLGQSTEIFKRLKPGVTERTGEGQADPGWSPSECWADVGSHAVGKGRKQGPKAPVGSGRQHLVP